MVPPLPVELEQPDPVINPAPDDESIAGLEVEHASQLVDGKAWRALDRDVGHDGRRRLPRGRASMPSGASPLRARRTVIRRTSSDWLVFSTDASAHLVAGAGAPRDQPGQGAGLEVVREDQLEAGTERLRDRQVLRGRDILGREIEVGRSHPHRIQPDELTGEAQDVARARGRGGVVGVGQPSGGVDSSSDDQRLQVALAERRGRTVGGLDALGCAADPKRDVVVADSRLAVDVERRCEASAGCKPQPALPQAVGPAAELESPLSATSMRPSRAGSLTEPTRRRLGTSSTAPMLFSMTSGSVISMATASRVFASRSGSTVPALRVVRDSDSTSAITWCHRFRCTHWR